MTKDSTHIVEKVLSIVLGVMSCGYLLYLLLTYDRYDQLAIYFQQSDWRVWCCLAAAFILMPLNMLLEACKWRYLLRDLYPMPLREAWSQTLKGLQGAFLTPGRLGEYPTRVLGIADKSLWPKAIAQGFVGSAALMAVNVICGMVPTVFRLYKWDEALSPWMLPFSAGLAIVLLIVLGIFQKKGSLAVLGWSFLRYVVFSVQFGLMLWFMGVHLQTESLLLIPIYYLTITVVPAMPMLDPAVKGFFGVMIFRSVTDDTASLALAPMLLWVLNTLIPMLYGMFLKKNT